MVSLIAVVPSIDLDPIPTDNLTVADDGNTVIVILWVQKSVIVRKKAFLTVNVPENFLTPMLLTAGTVILEAGILGTLFTCSQPIIPNIMSIFLCISVFWSCVIDVHKKTDGNLLYSWQ
jgi:hypothetical protein